MALFKILKGDSSRIDLSTTPFHDGYAYFTPDDGGFYIDSEDNGEQKRIRINLTDTGGESTAVTATLLASGWSSGKQTLSIAGVAAETNGVIGVSQSITDEQLAAVSDACLYICAQGTGSITIAVGATVPECDIPVTVILLA